VDSVVDCFVHQPMHDGLTYRIDPGQRSQASAFDNEGFKKLRYWRISRLFNVGRTCRLLSR
jgi:hypothetical protein